MSETPLFFPNGPYQLFGVLHEPDGERRDTAFAFVHPFGEEKLWAHRVFVSFARRLAAAGHTVLRFDCMGSGDSDGDFSESSIASSLSDVAAAVDLVRARSGARAVSLIGLRFGATIAAHAAETLDIRQLVLWAPILDGGRYMQELLRINLTTQMATHKEIRYDREALVGIMQQGGTANVDGYEMAYPYFAEASALQMATGRKSHAGPCLIVSIDKRPIPPPADLQAIAATYPHATVAAVQEEPFWKEIATFYDQAPALFAATGDWLQQNP